MRARQEVVRGPTAAIAASVTALQTAHTAGLQVQAAAALATAGPDAAVVAVAGLCNGGSLLCIP